MSLSTDRDDTDIVEERSLASEASASSPAAQADRYRSRVLSPSSKPSMSSSSSPSSPFSMLCHMFENVDRGIIRDVFDRCGRNPSLCAELLLPIAEQALDSELANPSDQAAVSTPAKTAPPQPVRHDPAGKDMFSTLSLDSLRLVAKFMSIGDLSSFAGVSKECQRLANTELCGITVLQNASAMRSWSDSRIIRMLARFKGLTALSLLKCREFENFASLPMALRDSPAFVSLNLGFCEQLEDTDVQLIIQGLPRLEQLDLSSTYIGDDALEFMALSNPPSLRRLVLNDCTAITNFGVRQILMRCPKLKQLSLQRTNITVAALEDATSLSHLYMPSCKSLHSLTLDASYVHMDTLVLSSCTNLKSVHLNLPRLKILNLSSSKQLDTLMVNAPLLQTLNLSGCNRLCSGRFGLPQLQRCNMYNCRSLLPGALESLFEHSSASLEVMDARGMIQLTDEQAERFVSGCTRLLEFDVVGCRALSQGVPERLAQLIQDSIHRRDRRR